MGIKLKTRLINLIKFLLILSIILLFSCNYISAKTTIRIGFGTTEEHPVYLALSEFKSNFEKETGGEFEVKLLLIKLCEANCE